MPWSRDEDLISGDDVDHKEYKELRDRLPRRLKELGFTRKSLSKAIGRGQTYISDLLKPHKNKNPPLETLQRIAQVLKCDLDYLWGKQDNYYESPPPLRIDSIPFAGIAEAGAFRKMTKPDPNRAINHERHPDYSKADHIYYDVHSNEMNAHTEDGEPMEIRPGMQAICVDLASARIPVQNGEIYVVHHTQDEGKTYERVLRRAAVFIDRIELLPESTEPGHETFIIPAHSTGGGKVSVYALVFSWQFNRKRKKKL